MPPGPRTTPIDTGGRSRARRGPKPAADRERALELARQRVLQREPFDVRAIAAELGLGRTTLYRWFGSREALLGEVLWTLARDTMTAAYDGAHGQGATRLRAASEQFIRQTSSFEPLLHLLRGDPQGTVSVLMTPVGGVQDRLVDLFVQFVEHERRRGSYRPAMDARGLAFLVVQVGMGFLFGSALMALPPDVDRAVAATAALITLEAPA
jgi:AcrR family transcriptional regulator